MSHGKLEEYFGVEYIHNWEQLSNFYESHFQAADQWIFRGQGNSEWGLKPSLEREMTNFGLDLNTAQRLERGLLRKFKRQCHHYITDTPKEKDALEWFALMQHHFAPTRLLDWTYSIFVALYFAIETADKCGCAVWAFNTKWMIEPFESLLKRYPDALQYWHCDRNILQSRTFTKLFLREAPIALVGAVTPQRLNQRIVIQQGIFLCPGDLSKTFEENLATLLSESKSTSKDHFIKLIIQVDLKEKKDILLRLQRMNVNNATLFPGLDGFARSLRTLMACPEVLLHPGHEAI